MNWYQCYRILAVKIALCAAVAVLAATILNVGIAQAELKVVGKGANMSLNPASIPANLQPNWAIMKKKCSKCHGLDRTITTLQSGVTPSGMPFEKPSIKAYGIKMLKKPDSEMNGAEVKSVIELLNWLHDEAAK